MSRAVLSLLVVLVVAVTLCSAQLNFSTGWGKRGGSPQEGCKSSMDSLMYLYKLIQNEAQKMVDCEKFAN